MQAADSAAPVQLDLFQEDFLASVPEIFLEGVDDLDFDLDMPGNIQYGFCLPEDRISKPVKLRDIPAHCIMPANAAALVARGVVPPPDSLLSVVVKGSFEFGDLVGALIRRHGGASECILSTLSIGEPNVDMLASLIAEGLIPGVTIIVSDYFYAQHRRTVYKYIYDRLPIDKTTVAVSGIHAKVSLLRLADGTPLAIEGSANLRSSQNVEQFCAINSEQHYEFHRAWLLDVVEKYKTKGRKGRYYGTRQ
jgi:uncharacterized membrane protein